jgi:hypothetical protein
MLAEEAGEEDPPAEEQPPPVDEVDPPTSEVELDVLEGGAEGER